MLTYLGLIYLQGIKRDDILAKYPPMKALTTDDLPQPGKEVPHRIYGWPVTEEYMIDYARRHRLVFNVSLHHRKRFGGREQYNYGDLTDDDLADEKLFLSLRRHAKYDVMMWFLTEVGATNLKMESPASRKWKCMLVLWDTRNYEETYATYQGRGSWERVKNFIDDALNECLPEGCERRTSLEWFWSRENTLAS